MKFEEQITIKNNGQSIDLIAYYDSGCKLYFKSQPACVINQKLANKLYCQVIDENEVSTINKNEVLAFTKIDEIYIKTEKKIFKDVFAAISSSNMEYEILLNVDMR